MHDESSSQVALRTRLASYRHAEPRPAPSPSTPAPRRPTPKRRTRTRTPPPSALPPLADVIQPDLILLFVGLNPGIQTSQSGHAYAHPSNLFWKLLFASGITDRRLHPTEDHSLPRRYACGNTNIVSRPTRDGSSLTRAELVAGAALLDDKVRHWRPEAVALVGKGIWDAVVRWRHGGRGAVGTQFAYGWQLDRLGAVAGEWDGARVFVATSTSGLAAGLRPAEKEAIWRPLGAWVQQRRRARAEAADAVVDQEPEEEDS